jgi:hypothetical protein
MYGDKGKTNISKPTEFSDQYKTALDCGGTRKLLFFKYAT